MSNQVPDAWDRLYSGALPPWEIGQPQPAVVELVRRGWLAGRLLDVGCGTGEHTILATRHGADALGVDHSPVAVRLAIEKARRRGVASRFAVADALALGELGEEFDVALDSGLFHVFDASERARYAVSLATVLRRGGLLFITCICDQQPGDWGPRVSEGDLRTTFDLGWTIEDLSVCDRETRRPEAEAGHAKAWLATIRHVGSPVRPIGAARQGRDALAGQLRGNADSIAAIGGSPLFVTLIAAAADDLEAGGVVAEVFEGVEPTGGADPALRLFAALHHLVLVGQAPGLVPYFAGAGERQLPADAWLPARRVLETELVKVRALVRLPVQTNEPGRAAASFGALLLLANRYRLPIALLEIGASAGLNLQVDRYCYLVDGRPLGDPDSPLSFAEPWRGKPVPGPDSVQHRLLVSGRAGCDLSPVDPLTEAGRLRLRSHVWPDDPGRMARLDAALEVARRTPVSVDCAAASPWLRTKLARRRTGELVVVWQSIVRPYLSSSEREELEAVIAAAGGRASTDRPLAHLQLEVVGGDAWEPQLTLRAWPGGEPQVLATCHIHGPPVTWHRLPDVTE